MDNLIAALEFIQDYGWFILISFVLIYFVYNKYKLPIEKQFDKSFKKDDEHFMRQIQNIEAVRLRQQAEIDSAALRYREDKLKKEELDSQAQIPTYKSNVKKNTKEEDLAALGLSSNNKNLSSRPRLKKPDYSPLMANSGGERQSFKRAQPSRGG